MALSGEREALRERAKLFSISVCRFAKRVPQDDVSRVLTRQLIRSGTSVGANQRSATLAKSDADLLNKLKTVEEEADESGFWLEMLAELEYCPKDATAPIAAEAEELRKIATAGVKTLRARLQK
jgi:four helix bundle protein